MFYILFSILVISSLAEKDPCKNENASNCYFKPNIAEITCTSGGTPSDCLCDVNAPNNECAVPALKALVDAATFDDMDQTKCKAFCTTLTDKCRYYRWMDGQFKKCYLMDKEQCEFAEGCDPDHCESGDVECDGSFELPNDVKCPTDGNYHSDNSYSNNYLHWHCTRGGDVLNFQANSGGMDQGTECITTHRCWRFPSSFSDSEPIVYTYDPIKYRCEDENGGGVWKGLSKNDTNGYDEHVINGDKQLQETTCNAENLEFEISNYNQEGLLITCTDGDVYIDETLPKAKAVVPAENYCMLLCDMYRILDFYPGWKVYSDNKEAAKGERIWYYKYNTAGAKEEVLNKDNIDEKLRCWTP